MQTDCERLLEGRQLGGQEFGRWRPIGLSAIKQRCKEFERRWSGVRKERSLLVTQEFERDAAAIGGSTRLFFLHTVTGEFFSRSPAVMAGNRPSPPPFLFFSCAHGADKKNGGARILEGRARQDEEGGRLSFLLLAGALSSPIPRFYPDSPLPQAFCCVCSHTITLTLNGGGEQMRSGQLTGEGAHLSSSSSTTILLSSPRSGTLLLLLQCCVRAELTH
eukprot:2203008-Rhodomonas_salina.3